MTDKPIASPEHMEMIEFFHSQLAHFHQVDDLHVQAVLTWKGRFCLCTFYRDVDDLMDDTWKCDVKAIDFVMVEDANDVQLCNEQVLSIDHGMIDEDD
jgi:hypothetical protein